jgi:hypothetical protein
MGKELEILHGFSIDMASVNQPGAGRTQGTSYLKKKHDPIGSRSVTQVVGHVNKFCRRCFHASFFVAASFLTRLFSAAALPDSVPQITSHHLKELE